MQAEDRFWIWAAPTGGEAKKGNKFFNGELVDLPHVFRERLFRGERRVGVGEVVK